MNNLSAEEFNEIKRKWRKEIKESFELLAKCSYSDDEKNERKLTEQRRLELERTISLSREVLKMYKLKLNYVNELCVEVDNLLVTLKDREIELNKLLGKD